MCLQEIVESLSLLDYPLSRFEVIIINVVIHFQAQLTIKLIRQENSGSASSHNSGAYHARCDFLTFIDDDCQISLNSLNILNSSFPHYPDLLRSYSFPIR